ncbi:WcaF family extracellular polysaccharide biosynthesis acetyltransferase [Cereibacter sphaeroides]|uniref:WcaF family extracellular polysaccharide biosynthesis acetyltransferase n=1 Tax=Cereibacter sphaeroides TaxID=1063 RepID=UPI000B77C7C4
MAGESHADVRLDQFSSRGFDRGASRIMETLWVAIGLPLISSWVPGSAWRVGLLRSFGADIGKGTVWKPRVRVKFPWKLVVGNYSWIGENAWIDNLAGVTIGNHACISQGVYICTGSHDWSSPRFELITREIEVGNNAWVGAKSSLAPGTKMYEGSVLTLGSVAHGTLSSWSVYTGNPAQVVRERVVTDGLDTELST